MTFVIIKDFFSYIICPLNALTVRLDTALISVTGMHQPCEYSVNCSFGSRLQVEKFCNDN